MGLTSIDDEFERVRAAVNRSTLAWRIAAFVAIVLTFSTWLFCAGASHQKTADQRAATTTVLKANTAAIAQAATVRAEAHVATAAKAVVASKAERRADTQLAHHQAARDRVAIATDTTVSIDGAPPVAVPPVMIELVRSADATIAALDSARATRTAERDALVVEVAATAREGTLYHERADTLQAVVDRASPSRCGTTCKVIVGGAVAGTVAVVAYNVGRQIARHLFVGSAKAARFDVGASIPLAHFVP